MKTFIRIMLLVIATAFIATAFTAPRDKWGFGFRKSVALESATAVSIDPGNLTLTYATLSIDTNTVISATSARSIVGDRIFLEVTADSKNRRITWGDNLTALNDSVLATKTKVFEFVYTGAVFRQIAEMTYD